MRVPRIPVVGDMKRELLKHLYNGADYYVYNALEDKDFDLMQIMYTRTATILPDDFQLEYNDRTFEGLTQIAVQLIDYRTMKVVMAKPWPTPSTKVETIPYMAWKNIRGQDCAPDTDWEPEDTQENNEGDSPTNMDNKRKRHGAD